jgi:hypothetical protein
MDGGPNCLIPFTLGLSHRITEWIPAEELVPPEGQGVLALTFRAVDACWLRLRPSPPGAGLCRHLRRGQAEPAAEKTGKIVGIAHADMVSHLFDRQCSFLKMAVGL